MTRIGQGKVRIEMARLDAPSRTSIFDEDELMEALNILFGNQITIRDPFRNSWAVKNAGFETESRVCRAEFAFDADETLEGTVKNLKNVIERPLLKDQKKAVESLRKYSLSLDWEYTECGGDFLTKNKLFMHWQDRQICQHKNGFSCGSDMPLEFVDTVANRIRVGLITHDEYVDVGDNFYTIREFIFDNVDDKNVEAAKAVLSDPKRRNKFLKEKLKEPLLDAEVLTINWSKY